MRIVCLLPNHKEPIQAIVRMTDKHVRFKAAHIERYHIFGEKLERTQKVPDRWYIGSYSVAPDLVRVVPSDLEAELLAVEQQQAALRAKTSAILKKALVLGERAQPGPDGLPIVGAPKDGQT